MTTVRGARARARIEITAAIKAEARTQLAAEGAAKLSLRAVARELGMVSSALYRYFPSRDDLLTALIVDAYDAVGAAAERAAAEAAGERPLVRWTAACRAVRAWAVAHPHEYALIYGSPVPGYTAPQDTNAPAARVGLVLVDIAREAHRGEGVALPRSRTPSSPRPSASPPTWPRTSPGPRRRPGGGLVPALRPGLLRGLRPVPPRRRGPRRLLHDGRPPPGPGRGPAPARLSRPRSTPPPGAPTHPRPGAVLGAAYSGGSTGNHPTGVTSSRGGRG